MINIEELFKKFVENTLSKKEYEAFMSLFSDPAYKQRIEKLMNDHWEKTARLDKPLESGAGKNRQKRIEKIRGRISYHSEAENTPLRKNRQPKISTGFIYITAAVVVILVASLFILKQFPDSDRLTVTNESQQQAITLKLEDGSINVIATEDVKNITDTEGNIIGMQQGGLISYNKDVVSSQSAYNELTVPYGNQFDLILADGTQIKLNAGSWLKYPTRFTDESPREVFLKGEAYFDVTKDESNPFVVNTSEISIEVLGTEFNLSFYPEDTEINTVLVEGAVKVYNNEASEDMNSFALLTPGQKASWNKQNKKILVTDTDVELYTAWKDGVLLFRRTPFVNIQKKLERHFNITIQNENTNLETQVYTATFEGESLYEILDAFREDTPFEYTYNAANNTITITQNPSNKNAYEQKLILTNVFASSSMKAQNYFPG